MASFDVADMSVPRSFGLRWPLDYIECGPARGPVHAIGPRYARELPWRGRSIWRPRPARTRRRSRTRGPMPDRPRPALVHASRARRLPCRVPAPAPPPGPGERSPASRRRPYAAPAAPPRPPDRRPSRGWPPATWRRPAAAAARTAPAPSLARAPRPAAAPVAPPRPRTAAPNPSVPGRHSSAGALISFLAAGCCGPCCGTATSAATGCGRCYALTPGSWRQAGGTKPPPSWASYLYYALFARRPLVFFARVGRWAEMWRRYVTAPLRHRPREERTAGGLEPAPRPGPGRLPRLRHGGASDAADRLAGRPAPG